jgi:hypothetical protein
LDQRIVEAAAGMPVTGAVTGWAALGWLGARWFTGDPPWGPLPVTLVCATDTFRAFPGMARSAERLNPREVTVVDGLRITIPARSAAFEARYAARLTDAVVAFDMAAYDDLVSLREAAEYLERLNGWTGIPQARAALALADENAWSPQEVRTRRAIEETLGLRLLTNRPIFDRAGNHRLTPDLLDEEAGVIVEYNGEGHSSLAVRRRDRARTEACHELGLEMVEVMEGDLADRTVLERRVRAARRRARFAAPGVRPWTIEAPCWWIPTLTVDQRREVAAGPKAWILDHRRRAA